MATPGMFAAVLWRVDHPDRRAAPDRPSTAAAAREFAMAGIPVFPCVPDGKRPLTAHGFLDATTDALQVAAWWQEHPRANVGVPTGAPSSVVVVDIDVNDRVRGHMAFDKARRANLVAGWEVLVRTPSGGTHVYYPAADIEQPCWQCAHAGIDFRGDGGYVVVPPSVGIKNGEQVPYMTSALSPVESTPVDAAALQRFLDPQRTRACQQGLSKVRTADTSRLAAWVAGRLEGERNRGLFWAACRLAENGTAVEDALYVLTTAASQAGLGEREIAATVRSAYRATEPGRRHRSGLQVPSGSELMRDARGRPAVKPQGL